MPPLIPNSNKNAKLGPQDAPPAQNEKQLNEVPKSDIAPNAEVWKKYVEETDRYDKELVDGWNNSLDMLLIFAALFSAISTAFVLESTQDLKPDYAETSAQALAEILLVLSSGNPANGSSLPSVEPSTFTPSYTAVMVNILWFMSLSLSVAVALIAIVAKDWCYQFMSARSGAFLSQGRRRQLRWEGIEKWRMQEMLNVLPLMMHAALLLFAAGLVLYLWDINSGVALPVLVTTVIVGLFYVDFGVLWDDTQYAADEDVQTALTQTVILLSQSLSFMAQIENPKLPDGYVMAIVRTWRVLDYSWESHEELGYGMAVKELGSLSLHIPEEWNSLLHVRDQLIRQTTLLEEISEGKTTGLSPEEIHHLIDGVTKSYLYRPDQSPNSLVKLLNMPEYQDQRQLRRALGVALIVAYIANYDHPGHDPALDSSARLKRAKKLYLELSTMRQAGHPYVLGQECGQLLLFGLVGFLLADPNPTWDLNSQLLANTVSIVSKDVGIIEAHSSLGLSPVEIMAKWLLAMRSARSQDPASIDLPLKETEVTIDMTSNSPVGHSGSRKDGGDFGTTREPLGERAYLERAKHILQLLRGETGIYNWGEGYRSSSSLDKLIQIKLHELIYKRINSDDGDIDTIPHCMSFLWTFTRSILAVSRKPYDPDELDARSILSPLRPHQDNLPEDMVDMEFAGNWIDKLKTACERDPQNVLDSKILDKMIKYYKSGDEYYDTTDTDDTNDTGETNDELATQPEPTEGPDSETRRTWLEVLEGLYKTCKEKAQTSNSDPQLEHGTNTKPIEEFQVKVINEEELTHGGATRRPTDQPVDSMEWEVEAGRLPPEVLEYVPYQA